MQQIEKLFLKYSTVICDVNKLWYSMGRGGILKQFVLLSFPFFLTKLGNIYDFCYFLTWTKKAFLGKLAGKEADSQFPYNAYESIVWGCVTWLFTVWISCIIAVFDYQRTKQTLFNRSLHQIIYIFFRRTGVRWRILINTIL